MVLGMLAVSLKASALFLMMVSGKWLAFVKAWVTIIAKLSISAEERFS